MPPEAKRSSSPVKSFDSGQLDPAIHQQSSIFDLKRLNPAVNSIENDSPDVVPISPESRQSIVHDSIWLAGWPHSVADLLLLSPDGPGPAPAPAPGQGGASRTVLRRSFRPDLLRLHHLRFRLLLLLPMLALACPRLRSSRAVGASPMRAKGTPTP